MQKYFVKSVLSVALIAIIGTVFLACSLKPESKDRVLTVETEIDLGQKLFFDNILSSDRSINCGSCHIPAFAFADTVAFSKGVGGRLGSRNAPSVMNVAFRDSVFWDGRAHSLEDQVVFPVENPAEMNLPFGEAIARIQAVKEYQKLFLKIYNESPNRKNIIKAISAFEKSLETEDTPNDRWLNDEEPSDMTAQMIRGRELFTGTKTKCFDCHYTPDFTSDEFHNIGLFDGVALNDSGRYNVTKRVEDIGKFKIPGLRNVAMTAPYMHNGMLKTLREVIDYYDDPSQFVKNPYAIDSLMPRKIGLTESEKEDLEAFLHSLTDDRFK
jgi:cytochrome c peroxidase